MPPPRLPSTGALLALDAVQRLGSARAAAEALGLTPSAVSHKLRALEAALGFPAVEPAGRGLRLTPRAARYLIGARRALGILVAAGAEAAEGPTTGALTVTAPPGFTVGWLAPRIGRFLAEQPAVRLSLSAPRAVDDLGGGDVAIAFGEARAAGAETLIEVAFFPVAAPALLNAEPALRRAGDLAAAPLLHVGGPEDWARWLEAAGAAAVDPARGAVFADLPAAHAAAAAGQGVALGDALTAAQALAEGRLIRPFAFEVPSRRAYLLRAGETPAARAFARWLRAELAGATG